MKHSKSKWRRVKERVYERDNGECIICHDRATDAHHVIFRSQLGKDDVNNVVCLCRYHHEMAHGTRAKEMRAYFQAYLQEVKHHGT